tara:strand:+ start:1258 stop:2025 length:768 start_codon:yes stop_codon:yes gene_type:complete
MKTIKKIHTIDMRQMKHKGVSSNLERTVISEPFKAVTEHGYPILYGKLPYSVEPLRRALVDIPITENPRQGGMRQRAQVTNDVAAVKNRNFFCASSSFSRQYRDNQKVLDLYAQALAKEYRENFPEYFHREMKLIESGKKRILPIWRIPNTPFTSGIINRDFSLGLHRDPKNRKGSLSGMVVMKKSARGGNLILPEYDIEFKMSDGTYIIFNGAEIIHGVTQIKLKENGHRISQVFYTAGKMHECGTPEQELSRQ